MLDFVLFLLFLIGVWVLPAIFSYIIFRYHWKYIEGLRWTLADRWLHIGICIIPIVVPLIAITCIIYILSNKIIDWDKEVKW